jgi:hypothetical protein
MVKIHRAQILTVTEEELREGKDEDLVYKRGH